MGTLVSGVFISSAILANIPIGEKQYAPWIRAMTKL
jgi:hypothetical protein